MKGIIVSGQKKGNKYISFKEYKNQIENKLNISPYDGTLNLKVDARLVNDLKESDGILIEGFIRNGMEYGNVLCFPIELFDIKGYIVLPEKTRYKDILEIIAEDNLRKKFGLHDDDLVYFNFQSLITNSKKRKLFAYPHIGRDKASIIVFYDYPFHQGRRDLCHVAYNKKEPNDHFYKKTFSHRKIVSLPFKLNRKTGYKKILKYIEENSIFIMSPVRFICHSLIGEWQIEVKTSSL